MKGEKAYWTAVCTSNQQHIPVWLANYQNAINSDTCLVDGVTFQPGQCKLKKIHVSRWQTREQFQYRVLQLTIKIGANPQNLNTASGAPTPTAWTANVIDEGLRALWPDPQNSGKKVAAQVIDGLGKPCTKPVALDGSGNVLYKNPGGTPPDYGPPSASQLVYNVFNRRGCPSLPFSVLPLSN